MKHKTKLKTVVLFFFSVVSVSAGIWFGYGAISYNASWGDLDGDGIPDWLEIVLGLDPNNFADGKLDIDGDTIPNNEDKSYGTRSITTIYPIEGERLP